MKRFARTHPAPDGMSGFTLVEMIAVVALVGILAACAGLTAVPMAEAYLAATSGTELAAKTQLAVARMSKEFQHLTTVSSSGASALSFASRNMAGTAGNHVLSWGGVAGNPLQLDGVTLLGGVQAFAMTYIYYSGGAVVSEANWTANSRGVAVSMQVQGIGGTVTFQAYSRNL